MMSYYIIKQDPALWACLAGLATGAKELTTAITAYSAINEASHMTIM